MLQRPEIKAIVADIDDTLLDTSHLRPTLEFHVASEMVKKVQEFVSEDSWLKVATAEEVFAQYRLMYRERGPNAQDHINNMLSTYGVEEPWLSKLVEFATTTYHEERDRIISQYALPGVRESISAIKKAGILCAALSNGPLEKQFEKLHYIGVKPFFDVVVTSEDISKRHHLKEKEAEKPNPIAYQEVCNRLASLRRDIGPENILYIDDRLDHLTGAALAGWSNTVRMKWGKYATLTSEEVAAQRKVPLEFAKPKHEIQSFWDVLSLVLPQYGLNFKP